MDRSRRERTSNGSARELLPRRTWRMLWDGLALCEELEDVGRCVCVAAGRYKLVTGGGGGANCILLSVGLGL